MKKRYYLELNCPNCNTVFQRRSDYAKKMSGLCTECANKKAGEKRKTHGFNNSNSRLHVIWANMKRRCLRPTEKERRNYGNIKLIASWEQFEEFMAWANSNGYCDNLTIDRIDNNKGYFPENCRFVDISTQNANKRKSDKNKTGYIGIWERSGKWRAKIQWEKKQIHLGTFKSKEDAAKARNLYIKANNLPHTLNII